MTPVAPEDLADCWPWVRQGIERLIAKTGEPILPEDVYHELLSNQAWLFLIEDVGFLVLKVHTGPGATRVLFVWLMWGEPGELKKREQPIRDWLVEQRDKARCKTIQHWSARPGWVKHGWKRAYYVYEMEN